jgi:hypothetical protein
MRCRSLSRRLKLAPNHPLQRLDMRVEIVTKAAQCPRFADLDDTELVI